MKRLACALVTTAATLAMAVLPADAAQPTPASGVTWNQNQRVEYRWKDGDEPPAWAKAAMNAAAADSNASRRAKAATFAYDANGPAWLAYTADLPTNWAIGYTVRNIPASFTMRIRPQGTQLDWGTLRWCQFYDDPPNGCYDLEMVTLHEFGHAQTLNHLEDGGEVDAYTDTVMHSEGLRTKAKTGWNQHVFGRCDVARLQIRYEPLTTSTPISTCLELSTDLTLAPGSGPVTGGVPTTLTARLKMSPGAIYANLAGDFLSERSVVLQRRSIGGSSWTSVGEMSPVTDTAGKYVKTMTLAATYDWRAVFNSPADEGLDGSVSNISRLAPTSGGCAGGESNLNHDPLVQTC